MTFRNGLDSLLRPEDSVLVLIDHQPYQLANLNSHDPQAVVNLTTALAKLAKAFNVPTILTSVIAGRGGLLFKQITDVFPGQEVIDRTWVNTWQDQKVVDAVKATGRKQLIIAGLWTEVCVAMPVIQAAGEGWDGKYAEASNQCEAFSETTRSSSESHGVPLFQFCARSGVSDLVLMATFCWRAPACLSSATHCGSASPISLFTGRYRSGNSQISTCGGLFLKSSLFR